MKDYNAVLSECRKELKELNIKTPDNIKLVVNKKAKGWGRCKKVNGNITIEVSSKLLDDNVPDTSLKNVIIHELLHSITQGDHHRYNWKALADKVNAHHPEYNIRKIASAEELGIKEESGKEYVLDCKGCGRLIHRKRLCKMVTDPTKRCPECGGRLELICQPESTNGYK